MMFGLLLVLIIYYINCIKLLNQRNLRNTYSKKVEYAIKRIKDRINQMHSTSCRISTRFMFLTISDIQYPEELNKLKLSSSIEQNVNNIRQLVNSGKVIHISIRPDHHFIILKKNDEDLYLLQGFQNRFYLKDWIFNDMVMKPYLTIQKFFDYFEKLLQTTLVKRRNELLLDIFYPKFFSDDKNKIDFFLSFFNKKKIILTDVEYSDFDFDVKEKGEIFRDLFNKVNKRFSSKSKESESKIANEDNEINK